jgi:hypothetical protein
MARKRPDRIITETPPESAVPDNDGATPAEQDRPSTKKDAIRRALADGVLMPRAIAQYALDEFGMKITPQHISAVKGELKREAATGRKKGRPGRKPRTEAPAVKHAARSTLQPASSQGIGLTAQDLASLADIAERAGGLDQLQEVLAILKRLR